MKPSGTVIELGDGVTSLSLGQRVGVSAMAGCGDCRECEKGRYTWCQSHRFYGRMHAERFIIPARACSLIPDDMPWQEAALLTGDGMGVPWHTAKKLDRADFQTILDQVATLIGKDVFENGRADGRRFLPVLAENEFAGMLFCSL